VILPLHLNFFFSVIGVESREKRVQVGTGGARGFNRGEARVGQLQARFRCIGGIDVDPAAMRDFQIAFENRKGAEKGAPVLSMTRDFRFPYIQPLTNTPDTGYGV